MKPAVNKQSSSYYNSSSVCLFVCLFVCSLCTLRSFDGSSPNLVGVCRLTSHLPLRGSFSKRSTGHFRFPLYYIGTNLTPHSCNGTFCLATTASNSAPFAVVHVNDVCRWTWQLLLRGSVSKTSTGRRADGSTGHFHFHYIIYDSRRLQAHATPLQKAHGVNGLTGQWVNGSNGSTGQRVTFAFTILYMIADDARLTPHRCKKHTASFARSTGKFPSH